jgi:aminoglycoside phosphotransferase family enzyme/predicted kinase
MPVDEQSRVLSFLRDRLDGPVESVMTHASHLLLGRDRVFKLKRPIRYGYLDYSTPELRAAACEAEYRLNQRTAPSLYLGAHRITEAGGGLSIGGGGDLVEACVEMRRFPEDCLFDAMADRGALTRPLLSRLADRIAQMHASAGVRLEADTARIERVLAINESAFRTTGLAQDPVARDLPSLCRSAYERVSDLLKRRATADKVRHCHGDLTLRNICLVDSVPTPFDCLEFSEDLATSDILYDVAFLLMDLWHKGLRREANWLMNRYLDRIDEEQGLAAVPFFMGMRAMVRAHVAAALAGAGGGAHAIEEARSYAVIAGQILQPVEARLVAVGGFSGSGKSTLAAALAPDVGAPPGARSLSSDRIRKALFGVEPEQRLPQEAYGPAVSAEVYARLCSRADGILKEGGSVLADAVFDREPDRQSIQGVAEALGLSFFGFWLDAPAQIQAERIRGRRDDASDATVQVLKAQQDRGYGELAWRRLDASQDVEIVAEYAAVAMEP